MKTTAQIQDRISQLERVQKQNGISLKVEIETLIWCQDNNELSIYYALRDDADYLVTVTEAWNYVSLEPISKAIKIYLWVLE